jgi:hypothetical protein
MSDIGRTIVVILSMHRSGSSLSTSILQGHGMSLGPFELLGGNSGNPHGHFEAQPILDLSRKVQRLAFGFSEDVPVSPKILSAFLKSQGACADRVEIPEELIERGRELMRRLIGSAPISGFKDPRTALIWPFWRRVLAAFPEVRVVPVVLLRSPHEIAMSLFTRSRGKLSYRTCLDVTAVNLRRMAAIVDAWPEPIARVRFGTPHFQGDLARAVASCGLDWDDGKARRHFDASCVHHTPASVTHDAQRLHDALVGSAAPVDPIDNLAIIEADAFAREALYRELFDRDPAQREWNNFQLDDLWHQLTEVQDRLGQAEEASRHHHECWHEAAGQLEAAREELRRYRELSRTLQDQLDVARGEADELRSRLDRFNAHPVLGPVLRGRRRMKVIIEGLQAKEAAR